MIRVLFFALEFPPLSQTGVHRSAKLVKYLRQFGVEPIVVTIDQDDAVRSFGSPLDLALCDDLPSDLTVYRISSPLDALHRSTSRLGRFLSVFWHLDDSFAKCMRPGLMAALPAIVARHQPQAVYVSMPPFTAGLLAAEVAEQLSLPLVVDMRDGWSHYCIGAFPTYAHFRLVLARERNLFSRAKTVVTVTPQLADVFRDTHPHLPREHFQVIPNGYDGSLEFPEVIDVPMRPADTHVTIGYVGRYYYTPEARAATFQTWWERRGHRKLNYRPVREDWLYRSPYFFFRALAELRRRQPELGECVRFEHVGHVPDWFDGMVAEHGLSEVVTRRGFVTHTEALKLVQGFDAQLCTSVKVEGGKDYALASKTFDYVRSGKPILGLVTDGAQHDFLQRSGMGIVADPDDLDACVTALAKIVRGRFSMTPDRAFLAQYHRREQAKNMAEILKSAAASEPPR